MRPFAFFGVASFFIGGLLGESLCIFWGCLFLHRRFFERAPLYFLGLSLFSSEVFWVNPFVFFGVASFFIRGLLDEPLCIFRGYHFFHRRSFGWAFLCFSGLPLFSLEVF
jgi:hypothetical protein